MRLFIAICFDDSVKEALAQTAKRLSDMAVSGNFTRCDNFHLTLHFIGESTRVGAIKQAMDSVSFAPFSLRADKCGRFRRDGGDIYWVGIGDNPSLKSVFDGLATGLRKNGFRLESRDFKPHLTLGREVIVKDDFDKNKLSISDIPEIFVDRICLMKSERVGGKLVYTCIYEKKADAKD